ncbi:ABC transporter ATP-binding protein [Solibaculum mannosilyticum]|uniref:ABC transporter ATP-binding protein n=1 Tax=Solibaculum mannosilyticum TaxID=2780922 RepID=UPI0007A8C70E|nr:putative ABC transporter ATP-binding protein YxlF [Eubacteriaceae bacterium CHKCI005]
MELTLHSVSKQYKNKLALHEFNYTFQKGIYGLLGPNGAGKSTLIKIMVDLLRPTSGQVMLDGKEIGSLKASYRRRIGYLPQSIGMYKNFSGRDMLLYIAALKGIEKKSEATAQVDQLLEMVNLQDDAKRKVGQYSGGMRQRLGIAQAFLGDPSIIIFDEPTAGLDPKERIRFKNILSEMASERMILLATHIVSDVEQIADYILLLKEGNLLLGLESGEQVEQMSGKVWSLTTDKQQYEILAQSYKISNVANLGELLKIRIVSDIPPSPDAQEEVPTLDDLYIYCFGEAGI